MGNLQRVRALRSNTVDAARLKSYFCPPSSASGQLHVDYAAWGNGQDRKCRACKGTGLVSCRRCTLFRASGELFSTGILYCDDGHPLIGNDGKPVGCPDCIEAAKAQLKLASEARRNHESVRIRVPPGEGAKARRRLLRTGQECGLCGGTGVHHYVPGATERPRSTRQGDYGSDDASRRAAEALDDQGLEHDDATGSAVDVGGAGEVDSLDPDRSAGVAVRLSRLEPGDRETLKAAYSAHLDTAAARIEAVARLSEPAAELSCEQLDDAAVAFHYALEAWERTRKPPSSYQPPPTDGPMIRPAEFGRVTLLTTDAARYWLDQVGVLRRLGTSRILAAYRSELLERLPELRPYFTSLGSRAVVVPIHARQKVGAELQRTTRRKLATAIGIDAETLRQIHEFGQCDGSAWKKVSDFFELEPSQTGGTNNSDPIWVGMTIDAMVAWHPPIRDLVAAPVL